MKGEQSMLIKFSKPTFFLGESIPVDITYENGTSETVVMDDPSKSLEVLMHAVDVKTNEDMNYTMGKIIVTHIDEASGQFALSEPPVEEMEIKPGSSFVFTSDLNERLFLRPGEFDCFLSDNDKESNHIKISVKLTRVSVENLFKLAQNKDTGYSRREWAMESLQILYPGFKLNLPLDNDPEDIKTQKEIANTQIYNEFTEWWNNNKNAKYIEELLK
jgi:hypothetical protein